MRLKGRLTRLKVIQITDLDEVKDAFKDVDNILEMSLSTAVDPKTGKIIYVFTVFEVKEYE